VNEFDISSYDHWESKKIDIVEKEPKTIRYLLNNIEELTIVYSRREDDANRHDDFRLNDKKLEIFIIGSSSARYSYTKFFLHKASEYFHSVVDRKKTGEKYREITFSKDKQEYPVSLDIISEIIEDLKSSFSARSIIPCPKEFSKLRIKSDARLPYLSKYSLDRNLSIEYPPMLSPFVRVSEDGFTGNGRLEKSIDKKVIGWVYENRFNEKTKKKEIEKEYEAFCDEIELSK